MSASLGPPVWPAGAVKPSTDTAYKIDLSSGHMHGPSLGARVLQRLKWARQDIRDRGLAYAEGYAAGWNHNGDRTVRNKKAHR